MSLNEAKKTGFRQNIGIPGFNFTLAQSLRPDQILTIYPFPNITNSGVH